MFDYYFHLISTIVFSLDLHRPKLIFYISKLCLLIKTKNLNLTSETKVYFVNEAIVLNSIQLDEITHNGCTGL
jgi:hypothetical protein